MKSKFSRPAMAAVAALAMVLTACSGTSDTSSNTSNGGVLEGKTIAYLTLSEACEYCALQAEVIVDELTAAGADVTKSVTDFDAAEQAQQINQAISKNPDLIVVWPTDSTSIIPSLERIRQAEIPVLVTNYELDGNEDLYTAWVGVEDGPVGAAMARLMVDGLEVAGLGLEGSLIEVTGVPGAASTIGRETGFRDEIAELAPGLTIIGSQPGNWDQTQATTAAANLLAQAGTEKVIGIYTHSDGMATGAIVAAERAGLSSGEDVVVVGADCIPESYANIEAGKQFGTLLQDPLVFGTAIAGTAQKIILGESFEKYLALELPTITTETLSECSARIGK